MLMKIDDVLIDYGFQKFAHWFQRLTGKTCFFLGKWMFALSSATLTVQSTVFLFTSSRKWESFLTLFLALMHGLLVWRLETKERSWEKGPKEFLNEDRAIFLHVRVLCFMAMVPLNVWQVLSFTIGGDVIDGLEALWTFLYVSGLYFSACTPLPPSKSKIRKLWESALASLDNALSPSFEPVPAKA